MKKGDHEKALRMLMNQSPDLFYQLKQLLAWNSSNGQRHTDDREVMLVSYVFLEESLKMLLGSRFELLGTKRSSILFDQDGDRPAILGSVYSRGTAAMCLGIISESCRRDLQIISLIRNTFAHTVHDLDFGHQSIIALTRFECLKAFGDEYKMIVDDKTVLMTINLGTPRARVLGYIILFWTFCSAFRPDGMRVYQDVFGPSLPMQDVQVLRPMSEEQLQLLREEDAARTLKRSPE